MFSIDIEIDCGKTLQWTDSDKCIYLRKSSFPPYYIAGLYYHYYQRHKLFRYVYDKEYIEYNLQKLANASVKIVHSTVEQPITNIFRDYFIFTRIRNILQVILINCNDIAPILPANDFRKALSHVR